MSTFDLAATTAQWREAYKQRLHLENLAKKIKDGPEAALKESILRYLTSQGLTGAKVPNGTISKRTSNRVQLTDTEKLCQFMLRNMQAAAEAGKPLGDCLLLQKTPHKGNITELVRVALGRDEDADIPTEEFNTIANTLGVESVVSVDITFSSK